MAVPTSSPHDTVPKGPNGTVMGLGFATKGIASLVGMVLVFQRDTATVTFIPGAPAAPVGGASPVSARDSSVRIGAVDPRGGSLLVRF